MRKNICRIAAAALVLFACGACRDVKDRDGKKEIRIGVLVPLSGSLAPYGKSALEGVKARVEQTNAAGGINGVPVALRVEDNMGNDTATINAYNKLAGSDRVVAVIGPLTSTCALALRRSAAKLKVPVVSPTATNDGVTRDNEFMFRACFNDSFQGAVIANFLVKDIRKAAALIDMNSDYSKGLARSFAEAFGRAGGQVLVEEKYQQKDTDFSTQLKKIKDCGAEVVFVPGYQPEVPLIVKQAKALGIKARLCGADGWDNDAVINDSGDNIEDCLLVGAFSAEDAREQVKSFLKMFADRGAGQPGTFEALGFDSAGLVLEALKQGATPDAVRNGLQGIRDFQAVTGIITIDGQGDAVKSAVVLKIAKAGDKYAAQYVATVSP